MCVGLQGNGGGLYGDTNSNIIVQHSNFSFNNAAVRMNRHMEWAKAARARQSQAALV